MRLTGLWWWIDRWRKSTAYTEMTLEEQGAYRNLLDEGALRGGPVPNDEEVLAKACGDPRRWRKVRPKVIARFKLGAEGWRNETLDEVLRASEMRRTARVESGELGAAARWPARNNRTTRSERLVVARSKGTHTRAEWEAMRAAYQRCLRCGLPESQLHGGACVKDHIVPVYLGGDDSIQNIQPMCRNCNSAKGQEQKDYRIGLPETRAEWIAQALESREKNA